MTLSNGYNGAELRNFLGQISGFDDELASLKGDYMVRCRGPRSRIKDVMAQARESGVNMTAFRELLADQRYARARMARIDALEDDDAFAFDRLLEALGEFGDTPLGAAALARARRQGEMLDAAS